MLIRRPNTKEKIYLYAMWGLFFLSCLSGKRNKEAYKYIQTEQNEVWQYIKRKGYDIHWNIQSQTYEIIKKGQ